MRKPFWLVDGKLREADFFVVRLRNATDLDEARYYFSAFISAARSVTYALQVCLKNFSDFTVWYDDRRSLLRSDPIARYFHEIRNQVIHVGLNPLETQTRDYLGVSQFFVVGERAPEQNAVRAAEHYMALLVKVARDAYAKFWSALDLPPDLTLEQLQQRGKTLEAVEEEFGLPPGWTAMPDATAESRLEHLKIYSATDIERLAQRYSVT